MGIHIDGDIFNDLHGPLCSEPAAYYWVRHYAVLRVSIYSLSIA